MKRGKSYTASIFRAASFLMALLAMGSAGAQEQQAPPEQQAPQEQLDWRIEFEAVCGKTDDSMSLMKEKLTDLIARSDKLAERIGAEEETLRKVYLKRLKLCRDLFVFILESKISEETGGENLSPQKVP